MLSWWFYLKFQFTPFLAPPAYFLVTLLPLPNCLIFSQPPSVTVVLVNTVLVNSLYIHEQAFRIPSDVSWFGCEMQQSPYHIAEEMLHLFFFWTHPSCRLWALWGHVFYVFSFILQHRKQCPTQWVLNKHLQEEWIKCFYRNRRRAILVGFLLED